MLLCQLERLLLLVKKFVVNNAHSLKRIMHSVLLLCSLYKILANIVKLTAWCNSVNIVSPLLSRCRLTFCSINKVFVKFTRWTAVCTSIFVVINCRIGTRPTFTPELDSNNSVAFLKCFQCTPRINQLTMNLKLMTVFISNSALLSFTIWYSSNMNASKIFYISS